MMKDVIGVVIDLEADRYFGSFGHLGGSLDGHRGLIRESHAGPNQNQ
jgi:hypothetical protein